MNFSLKLNLKELISIAFYSLIFPIARQSELLGGAPLLISIFITLPFLPISLFVGVSAIHAPLWAFTFFVWLSIFIQSSLAYVAIRSRAKKSKISIAREILNIIGRAGLIMFVLAASIGSIVVWSQL